MGWSYFLVWYQSIPKYPEAETQSANKVKPVPDLMGEYRSMVLYIKNKNSFGNPYY